MWIADGWGIGWIENKAYLLALAMGLFSLINFPKFHPICFVESVDI